MRIVVLSILLLLAGCVEDGGSEDAPDAADPGSGDDGGQGGDGGGDAAEAEPRVSWSEDFDVAFTMAVGGELPQSGENCVGGDIAGLAGLVVNATWTPDVDLRLVVATDSGGDIVADTTGSSPLSVDVDLWGDQHVTVALLAPESGSAPGIEGTLELSGVVSMEPSLGTAACAF